MHRSPSAERNLSPDDVTVSLTSAGVSESLVTEVTQCYHDNRELMLNAARLNAIQVTPLFYIIPRSNTPVCRYYPHVKSRRFSTMLLICIYFKIKRIFADYIKLCDTNSWEGFEEELYIEDANYHLISAREKLAFCDVTNLPYMDINWQSISIYGEFMTLPTTYYSCADISKGTIDYLDIIYVMIKGSLSADFSCAGYNIMYFVNCIMQFIK